MPTTARGIWTPSDTDNVDFTTDLATMAGTVDTAISNGLNSIAPGANRFTGTTAQRIAFTSQAKEGASWWDTTDNSEYVMRGGAWLGGVYRPSFLSAYSGSSVRLIISGGLVTAYGAIITTASALVTVGDILSAPLPAMYRPRDGLVTPAIGAGVQAAKVNFTSAGSIQIAGLASPYSANYAALTASWSIAA